MPSLSNEVIQKVNIDFQLDIARVALEEAQQLADEYKTSFHFSLGEASNTGQDIVGMYYGKGMELDGYDRYEIEPTESSLPVEEISTLEEGTWSYVHPRRGSHKQWYE